MNPWLSIVVPTPGRPTLMRLLDSIGAPDGVEVLLVADTHGADFREQLAAAKKRVGKRARWIEHDAGYHCYGQPQRNEGMRAAMGLWLMFSQDDNVLMPHALDIIRQGIAGQLYPRPLLFRVDCWQAGIVWKAPVLVEKNIDGDCVVVPNDPARLGIWGNRYNGDWDFISQTAAAYEGDVAWCNNVIACSPERTKAERRLLEDQAQVQLSQVVV